MRRRAFTLLEAIVAFTILAMAAAACLELRVGALANTRRLAGKQEDARAAQAVFDLALAGLLGPAQRADPDEPDSPAVWTGERDGRAYRLVRAPVEVSNPVRDAAPSERADLFPANVGLYRYTLELGGGTYTMEWGR